MRPIPLGSNLAVVQLARIVPVRNAVLFSFGACRLDSLLDLAAGQASGVLLAVSFHEAGKRNRLCTEFFTAI
jgi:hypothetical protein